MMITLAANLDLSGENENGGRSQSPRDWVLVVETDFLLHVQLTIASPLLEISIASDTNHARRKQARD